jgi:hypothetical protein
LILHRDQDREEFADRLIELGEIANTPRLVAGQGLEEGVRLLVFGESLVVPAELAERPAEVAQDVSELGLVAGGMFLGQVPEESDRLLADRECLAYQPR